MDVGDQLLAINLDEEVEHPGEVLNCHREISRDADCGCSTVDGASSRVRKPTSTLKVEFGWRHYSTRKGKFFQVKGTGGGTCKADMQRSATYQDCLLKAKELFFPNSSSLYGTLADMETPYLANFKLKKHNEEGFTVESFKERTKMNSPRIYLVTKPKTKTDSRPQRNSPSSDTSYAMEVNNIQSSSPSEADSGVLEFLSATSSDSDNTVTLQDYWDPDLFLSQLRNVDDQSPMEVTVSTVEQGQVGTEQNGSLTAASGLNTVFQGVSTSVQGILPQYGGTEGGYPFHIALSEPLPADVTSGMAYFGHVGSAQLTKVNPCLFGGTVPGSLQPGVVTVAVWTQSRQHLGTTHFTYINKARSVAMELLSGCVNITDVISIVAEEDRKTLSDCSNQTKQQHSLQFLQLLVYTAAQTGEKQFIEIIFSTSAGQIVFDSYKDRAQLPEDVARANGHDDLANYLQDFTTRFSEEPEFSLKEAHVIDWSELEAAATAAQTQGCLTEETSSDDSSENSSDTDYFADVETSIDSSELSRSTSEDDTSEPYSREKTKASAHQSIYSIVKGAFAENGTMDKIRRNILEGVKQKYTVLILEDSHFDSSLPEAVNYTLAFQLATGSKNIPRHLHTAKERFLASRENIIRQPTMSFCKLLPDVLIESSFVKNNNDHILRIDASKQSNQLNEDIFAELRTRIPIEKAIPVEWKSSDISVKQFGALTHCDLWVFTSAFRPTRKTLFVYFADRRDALPHSYFFEDEDCESQIRCWKWKRSENNSWKFTERLEAEKLPPGREKSQMESHADLPVTYIVRDKQALRLSWMHAMMHHCWTIKSTKKTSNITIFVASLGNDGILEDTCGPELGIALAKVKSLTTLHLTINSNDGILERTWETYLYSSLAEIKSLTTLHLTINSNDGIDGWRWAHELGYGLAKIKSLTTLHLTINSNDGIGGCIWGQALGYGLAKVKSLTALHLTINSNNGFDGCMRTKALGYGLAEIKSLTTLHLTINSNDGIDECRWAEKLGYGLAKIKSLTTLHLTINSNDGIDGCMSAEMLGYGLAEIKSLTTLHLTINSNNGIPGCMSAEMLGYSLAEIKSLTTLHLTINSNDVIHGCKWAEALSYGLAEIKSLTTLHLTINSNDGIDGCRWAEELGYGLAEIKSQTTVTFYDGISACMWREQLFCVLERIKSLTTLHLKINGNDGIFKRRVTDVDLAHGRFKRICAHRLHYGLAESKSLTRVCLKANNRSSSLDELMLPYPSNFDGSWVNRSGYQENAKKCIASNQVHIITTTKAHDLSGMSYYTNF